MSELGRFTEMLVQQSANELAARAWEALSDESRTMFSNLLLRWCIGFLSHSGWSAVAPDELVGHLVQSGSLEFDRELHGELAASVARRVRCMLSEQTP